MVLLSQIPLAHLAPQNHFLYVALFTNLENGDFLRQQLLAGNSDFEYAFVNCDTVVSTTHLLAACFRAVNDLRSNRLRSRNVHSEIVFSLGINNNIASSLKTFGVDASTRHLLAIKVGDAQPEPSDDDFNKVQSHLGANVKGEPLPFTDEVIAPLTDWSKVRKAYKLAELDSAWRNGSDNVTDAQKQDAETSIIGMIALRGS